MARSPAFSNAHRPWEGGSDPIGTYSHPVSIAQAPLVGNAAPDFTATAVFDQEFVDIKLSQYKVRDSV